MDDVGSFHVSWLRTWGGRESGEELGSPGEIGVTQQAGRDPSRPFGGENCVDPLLAGGIGRGAEGACDRTEFEVEQAVPSCRLEIILAFRRRPADQLDLPVVKTKSPIGFEPLRFARAIVRQQDPLRTGFDDRGGDAARGNVGEALCREDDRDIPLPQRLQPFPDPRGEQRVIEEDPSFIEDQQSRPSVEPRLQLMEQVGQDRCDHARLPKQGIAVKKEHQR